MTEVIAPAAIHALSKCPDCDATTIGPGMGGLKLLKVNHLIFTLNDSPSSRWLKNLPAFPLELFAIGTD